MGEDKWKLEANFFERNSLFFRLTSSNNWKLEFAPLVGLYADISIVQIGVVQEYFKYIWTNLKVGVTPT